MTTIDMQRLRDALPKRAIVKLRHNTKPPTSVYIECIVRFPSLFEKGTEEESENVAQVFQWQREIIGAENISEFYTEETGSHWYIYLKRVPLEFINATDEDIKTYSGFTVEQLKQKL